MKKWCDGVPDQPATALGGTPSGYKTEICNSLEACPRKGGERESSTKLNNLVQVMDARRLGHNSIEVLA